MTAVASRKAGKRQNVPLPYGKSMVVAEKSHAASARVTRGHHPMSKANRAGRFGALRE